jgi:hypothetical protein
MLLRALRIIGRRAIVVVLAVSAPGTSPALVIIPKITKSNKTTALMTAMAKNTKRSVMT